MIKSFFAITLRLLWRNKVTSFVNLLSLTIGITAFLFIMLYVRSELGYDRFNENYAYIYRLEADDFAKLPPVIGPHVNERIPEITNFTRLAGNEDIDVMYKPGRHPEKVKHAQVNLLWADSTTFDVFSFPFLKGQADNALTRPFTCVMTRSVAWTLFGDSDPIGKTVTLFDHEFEITGVIHDVSKSHLDIKVLVSLSSLPKVFADRDLSNTGRNSWLWSATYLLTSGNIDKTSVERKINEVVASMNNGILFDTKFNEFHLLPLSEIYFEGARQNLDYGFHGSFSLIIILSVIGIFTLVLAAINYINLTTARSAVRAKEIAVRRVVGSSAAQVRVQMVLESLLLTLIALVVSVVLTQIFTLVFNEMAMVNISISDFNTIAVWAVVVIGAIVLGVAAGIYPALYLTRARPVPLMKGLTNNDDDSAIPRNILMTFQFTLSIILMICALVNLRQLQYVRNADVGFYKEQIIQIETPTDIQQEFFLREAFKDQLSQHEEIVGMTYSAGSPAGHIRVHPIEVDGKKHSLEFFLVDHDFFNVMNVELVAGDTFPRKTLAEMPSLMPENFSIVINEAAVRELGLKSPVGKTFYWDDQGVRRSYEVVGVVKDFHFRSLHHKISPLMMVHTPPMITASIKVRAAKVPVSLKIIENEWKKVYGERLFAFTFLDETFNRQYRSDEQVATVIIWFTGVALIIACLGLFALSSFMITRRTKEIGIRKSMGASTRSIYLMLSWDFLKWVVAAVIIAYPVSWYLMNLWLSRFAYHVYLEKSIFIFAASLALGVALLTITWHSIRAANANPIDSLRYE